MRCKFPGLHASLLYAEFETHTQERAFFKAHLACVARVLREIERAEDGEPDPADEAEAIRDCLAFTATPASAAHGLAALCRPVLEGYRAGLSALDGDMLQRLVDLGDQASEIVAMESSLRQARAALRGVLAVFDNHGNRDPERNPLEFAALQIVYRALGLQWPEGQ
jgi:hypothetical protein